MHVKSLAWCQHRPALFRTNQPKIFSKNAKTPQRKLQKFKYFLRPFGHFGLVDKFGKAIKKSIDLFKNGRPMRSFHVSRPIFQVCDCLSHKQYLIFLYISDSYCLFIKFWTRKFMFECIKCDSTILFLKIEGCNVAILEILPLHPLHPL